MAVEPFNPQDWTCSDELAMLLLDIKPNQAFPSRGTYPYSFLRLASQALGDDWGSKRRVSGYTRGPRAVPACLTSTGKGYDALFVSRSLDAGPVYRGDQEST